MTISATTTTASMILAAALDVARNAKKMKALMATVVHVNQSVTMKRVIIVMAGVTVIKRSVHLHCNRMVYVMLYVILRHETMIIENVRMKIELRATQMIVQPAVVICSSCLSVKIYLEMIKHHLMPNALI